MRNATHTLAAALTGLACLTAAAQSVPHLINYQGQLLDAAGAPMPTGDYTVEVRLFPVESGGAASWGPQIFNGQSGTGLGPRVAVVQGRFNLMVGPQDTAGRDLADVFAASPSAYLELQVGVGSPISPRQQLLAAPYALNAEDAAQLRGFAWDAVFPDTGRPDTGHLPGSKIADGAITTSKIAAAAVTPAQLDLGFGKVAIGQAVASYSLDVLSTNGAAIHAVNSANGVHAVWLAENNDAMYAVGNVIIQGQLVKTTGSFRIDHPLDPANKYLYHSFVESPDMKNIYDGLVALDANGEAVVSLPDWFEALNQEFRYQLTAVGAPGPNLHIAEELAQNRFKIAGGVAGMKVSWQVTGVRHDAYANAHRIQVEADKPPGERGQDFRPENEGLSAARGTRPETAEAGPGAL